MDNLRHLLDNFGQFSPIFDLLKKGYDLGFKLCPPQSIFCPFPYPKMTEKIAYCVICERFVHLLSTIDYI